MFGKFHQNILFHIRISSVETNTTNIGIFTGYEVRYLNFVPYAIFVDIHVITHSTFKILV
jgi:hypothetical protein